MGRIMIESPSDPFSSIINTLLSHQEPFTRRMYCDTTPAPVEQNYIIDDYTQSEMFERQRMRHRWRIYGKFCDFTMIS